METRIWHDTPSVILSRLDSIRRDSPRPLLEPPMMIRNREPRRVLLLSTIALTLSAIVALSAASASAQEAADDAAKAAQSIQRDDLRAHIAALASD